MKTDLVIRCSDGDFHLHKVVLAANLHSLAYLRALKTTQDEDNQIILIPDVKKSYINHLMSLLYTGRTENISAEEIDEINVVSDLLKISSLTLSRVQPDSSISDLSDVESDQKLTIEVIEEQKTKRPASKKNLVKSQAAFLKEESSAANLIRRSKRAKIKNKQLNDFETPLFKAISTDENQLKGTYFLFFVRIFITEVLPS